MMSQDGGSGGYGGPATHVARVTGDWSRLGMSGKQIGVLQDTGEKKALPEFLHDIFL